MVQFWVHLESSDSGKGVIRRLSWGSSCRYAPKVVVKKFIMKLVGPTKSRKNIKRAASRTLALLRYLMPLSRPDRADRMNRTVTVMMIATWVEKLFSMPNRKDKPAEI